MGNIKKIGTSVGGVVIGVAASKVLSLLLNFIMTKQHLSFHLQITIFLIICLLITIVGVSCLSIIDNDSIIESEVNCGTLSYDKILEEEKQEKLRNIKYLILGGFIIGFLLYAWIYATLDCFSLFDIKTVF